MSAWLRWPAFVKRESRSFPYGTKVTAADSLHRYKPDVKIRFITEELGFESDEQSARFVLEYASGELLQERDGHVRLLTGKAGRVFEDAKSQAYRVVDIKGQI